MLLAKHAFPVLLKVAGTEFTEYLAVPKMALCSAWMHAQPARCSHSKRLKKTNMLLNTYSYKYKAQGYRSSYAERITTWRLSGAYCCMEGIKVCTYLIPNHDMSCHITPYEAQS